MRSFARRTRPYWVVQSARPPTRSSAFVRPEYMTSAYAMSAIVEYRATIAPRSLRRARPGARRARQSSPPTQMTTPARWIERLPTASTWPSASDEWPRIDRKRIGSADTTSEAATPA